VNHEAEIGQNELVERNAFIVIFVKGEEYELGESVRTTVWVHFLVQVNELLHAHLTMRVVNQKFLVPALYFVTIHVSVGHYRSNLFFSGITVTRWRPFSS
jgi:hypothetical protein